MHLDLNAGCVKYMVVFDTNLLLNSASFEILYGPPSDVDLETFRNLLRVRLRDGNNVVVSEKHNSLLWVANSGKKR